MARLARQTTPIPRRAYRIPEVMEALGVGHSKVYTMIESGALKSVKIGSVRLITADSVEALLRGAAE